MPPAYEQEVQKAAKSHLLQIQYPDPVFFFFFKCIDGECSSRPIHWIQNREAQETETTETKVSHVSNSCFILHK